MPLKHIAQGIGITLGGAFLWLFYFLSRLYDGPSRFASILLCVVFGVVLTSVYLVPLGVCLGLIIPDLVVRHHRWRAVIEISAITIAIAGMTSLGVALLFDLLFGPVFISMLPVCAMLLGTWSARLFARKKILRAPFEPQE